MLMILAVFPLCEKTDYSNKKGKKLYCLEINLFSAISF